DGRDYLAIARAIHAGRAAPPPGSCGDRGYSPGCALAPHSSSFLTLRDTMQQYARSIAAELALRPAQVEATLKLLAEGNTIPFIARYRKEATGELDEVQIRDIRDRAEYLTELDERRATVLTSIEEQGKLTPELKLRIEAAATKAELEDLYRPFRPKRRTRATIAIERGLEPLAELLLGGSVSDVDLRSAAERHVDAEKG